MLKENLKNVQNNIKKACERVGRKPEEVTLVAVSKMKPLSDIEELLGTGQLEYGENYVQELCDKYENISKPVHWHMIGHLQTNKVKYIIDSVSLIQSVDSVKLAAEINKNALRVNKLQDILIEVNIGNEESKGGIDKSQLQELLSEVSEMKNIRVKGLMAIPPIENPEKFLCDMQQLYIDISSENMDNINMDILSMGMSNDYVKAIEYGSNLVRIGRGLFGPRNYNK